MESFRLLSHMFEAPHVRALTLDQRRPVSDSLRRLLLDVIDIVEPNTIVEIGAFEGTFSRQMRAKFPSAEVIAFEANPRVYEQFQQEMKNAKIDYRNVAVGSGNGVVSIHIPEYVRNRPMPCVNRMASLNKLVIPGSITVEVKVQSVCLDSVLARKNDRKAVLWIDVEGAVGMVLDGARNALKESAIIFCEMEQVAMWSGQQLAVDIVSRLANEGFEPCARDCERPDQFNVLFLRKELGNQRTIVNKIYNYVESCQSFADAQKK